MSDKYSKNILPIILVVEDASEECIDRAKASLDNFYNACLKLNSEIKVVIRTLKCTSKCEWLTNGYEGLDNLAKYTYNLAKEGVDIKDLSLTLLSRFVRSIDGFSPLVFFFSTNEYFEPTPVYFDQHICINYQTILVNFSKSESSTLFASAMKSNCLKLRTINCNEGAPISSREFYVEMKFHIFREIEFAKMMSKSLRVKDEDSEHFMELRTARQRSLKAAAKEMANLIKVPCAAPPKANVHEKPEMSGPIERPAPGAMPLDDMKLNSDSVSLSCESNDVINYSLICEKEIKRNSYFELQFATYIDKYSFITEKIARDFIDPHIRSGVMSNISNNSEVTLILYSPNCESVHDEQSFIWDGKFNITPLVGIVDKHFKDNRVILAIDILVNGIRVTTVKTVVDLTKSNKGKLDLFKKDVKRVFFSYSSKDRKTVLNIVKRTTEFTGRSIEFFLVVLKLRAGENWQHRIYEEIDSSDTFCLIWSYSAYRSKWVKKEWEYALDNKGITVFNPININNEKKHHAPIPRKLSSIHFANYKLLNKESL